MSASTEGCGHGAVHYRLARIIRERLAKPVD
jgi:hypothetical protein